MRGGRGAGFSKQDFVDVVAAVAGVGAGRGVEGGAEGGGVVFFFSFSLMKRAVFGGENMVVAAVVEKVVVVHGERHFLAVSFVKGR